MPELPDLTVISENLNKRFAHKKVQHFEIFRPERVAAPTEQFKKELENQELESIERSGKELLLTFSGGARLGIHLMLNGKIHFVTGQDVKHKIFEIVFDNGDGFIVSDIGGLARPTLNPLNCSVPDALEDGFNFAYLKNILVKSRKGIKKVLTDQKIVRGIGNAYADEILWDAKVSPFSVGSKIPDEYIHKIVDSCKKVLNDAIAQIKAIEPDIISGEIRSFLNVHTSKKSQSPTGYPIKIEVQDKRQTFYTDEQLLFK